MNRSIQAALAWKPAADTEYGDIRYEIADGIAKITICRPEVRNAFRPQTLFELQDAFERARNDPDVGVIVLTGEGPDAFCSGGDQRIRGDDGYVGDDGIGRLNVLDLQVQIRRAARSRWSRWWRATRSAAATCCTSCATSPSRPTTPASARPARSVGSFDGGYGSGLLARVGRAEEGARDLVPVPPVRRAAGARHGPREHGRPARGARGGDRRVVPADAEHSPLALRMIKASLQRGRRRPRRHPAARRRRDAPLLHERGGAGGQAARTSRSAGPSSTGSPKRPLTLTTAAEWVAGARPRTLAPRWLPVLVGTAAVARSPTAVIWWRAAAALVVALALQVGRQLRERLLRRRARHRQGPRGSAAAHRDRGSRRRRAVERGASLAFARRRRRGPRARARGGPAAARRGRGRHRGRRGSTRADRAVRLLGLGEVMVLVFFGFVATVGSAYVQMERCRRGVVGLARVGLLACAILLANNVRDIATDRVDRQAHARRAHRRPGSVRRLFVGCSWARSWPLVASGVSHPGR